jgi:hypothetical protein
MIIWQDHINTVMLGLTIIIHGICAWGFREYSLKTVSDERSTRFTPHWIIMLFLWGVTYGSQILFVTYQYITQPVPSLNESIWVFYFVLCLLNIGHNVLFCFRKLNLSLLFSYAMGAMLFLIYFRLDISYFWNQQDKIESWINFPTFSFYFGMIWFQIFSDMFYSGNMASDIDLNIEKEIQGSPNKNKEKNAVISAIMFFMMFGSSWIFQYGDLWISVPMFIASLGMMRNITSDEREIFWWILLLNGVTAIISAIKLTILIYS